LRALLLGLVAIGSAGLAIAAYATNALRTQELNTINTRFSIRGTQKPPSNIVVVKVDDQTLADLKSQWPYPRAMHARVINKIVAQHPAAIEYDVQFSEPSYGSANAAQNDELALLNAINNAHHKTVFSITATEAGGGFQFLGSSEGPKLLREVGARAGQGTFPTPNSDSTIRQMNYSFGGLKSLAVATAAVATQHPVNPSQFANGHDWIDYRGPNGTFPSISFSTVYKGQFPKNYFRNKIVVIGATSSVLQDIHATPIDPAMSGPEIQANALATVLRGNPLHTVPGWVNIALIVLLAVAVPLVALRFGPLISIAVAVGLGIAFSIAVQLAFNAGAIVSFIYPMVALVLSAVGSLATLLVTEAFERLRVRDLFTRFVPENVVDEVLASSDGLRLGGVQREGTVMFSDLRGFTSLAESLTPARVIEILNRYLSEMSDAILDHGGTLVAYMGDGIMAVFGAPLPQEDHADRALAAAREMLDVRLPRFNSWLQSENLSEGFRMGIGLNSGGVMSGHVGSERRVEYTAVGDTTNTASRIEALTKGTPHQLYLSGATKEALTSPPADLLHVGETEIRGRAAKLELWSVGAGPPQEPQPEPESKPVVAGPAG
jgi:adenylate cyclase